MNNDSARIACAHCRSNNFVGAANCWHCGKPLPPPEVFASSVHGSSQALVQASNRSNNKLVWFILPLVLAFGLGALIARRPGPVTTPSSKIDGRRELSHSIGDDGPLVDGASRQGRPGSETQVLQGSSDPVESQARRAIDRLSVQAGAAAPPADQDGSVHLQTGGSISREQWEKAQESVKGASQQ